MVKEVFYNLATAGPTMEEVAPFLAEMDTAELQSNAPRTLIAAFLRGLLEIPGMSNLPTLGMTEEELASSLQRVMEKYEGDFQCTALVVAPGKTPIIPLAMGIGLAIVAIATFATLRRKKVPREEVAKK